MTVVRIRLVGRSESEIDEAIFALTSALAQLDDPTMFEITRRPGRARAGHVSREWVAYGKLSLDRADVVQSRKDVAGSRNS
ncbi:MAG TPA: hypothetical protein VGJ60_06865 [Chloroflexota bacterium]|jgi:hypothetical protein